MPAPKKTAKSSLSFEQALADLNEIVDAMESEQLPLEDLVAQYEVGSKLLKHCQAVLSSAQKKIELITLADTELESDSSLQNESAEKDENNDISLF